VVGVSGGKIDAGETEYAALRRELLEELGIEVLAAERLLELRHDYPERSVELCMWRVTGYQGAPRGLDDQALKWMLPSRLASERLLEADLPVVAALNRR
jgi:8-oxo-dGTP diphosphatase